jgi:hypothetical protein
MCHVEAVVRGGLDPTALSLCRAKMRMKASHSTEVEGFVPKAILAWPLQPTVTSGATIVPSATVRMVVSSGTQRRLVPGRRQPPGGTGRGERSQATLYE